jgi:hypothetical protein
MMKQKQAKQKLTRDEFAQKLCDEINNIDKEMDSLYQQGSNTKESIIERIREALKICAQDNNPFKAVAIVDYVLHNEPPITVEELHLRRDPYRDHTRQVKEMMLII